MRNTTTFICAFLAGTAVRFLFRNLPRRRRQRRLHHCDHNSSNSTTYPSLQSDVLQLFNTRIPLTSCSIPTECTFCLETIRIRHPIRCTPCGHSFHPMCLQKWVLYSAETALSWRSYSLADDGSIVSTARPPVCPNCSADLHVLPERRVKAAMLTAVARALSVPNLAIAAEMYDAGLVRPQGILQIGDYRERQGSYVRNDSNLLQPTSIVPPGSITAHDEEVMVSRRSFPEWEDGMGNRAMGQQNDVEVAQVSVVL